MRIDFNPQDLDQCRDVLKLIDALHHIVFTMNDDSRLMYIYSWNESGNQLSPVLARHQSS